MDLSPCVALEKQRIQVRSKDPPSPGNAAKTEIPALESLDGKEWSGGEGGKAFARRGTDFSKEKRLLLP